MKAFVFFYITILIFFLVFIMLSILAPTWLRYAIKGGFEGLVAVLYVVIGVGAKLILLPVYFLNWLGGLVGNPKLTGIVPDLAVKQLLVFISSFVEGLELVAFDTFDRFIDVFDFFSKEKAECLARSPQTISEIEDAPVKVFYGGVEPNGLITWIWDSFLNECVSRTVIFEP